MGERIARRLLDAGHELVVWNRTAARAEPLSELGATVAATPAEAASETEAAITMVTDPLALVEVTEGPEGVAAGPAEHTTVIQMSTVGPPAIARLESVLRPGAGLLDAPVLGSRSEAEGGTLQIYASGPPELVERWTPLLSTLGTVHNVGPLGAGQAAKLVANTTLVGVVGVLGEALAVAGGLGLSREATFEVLGTTALASQAERRRADFESGDYPPRFPLSLARKDADLIVTAAAASNIELPVVEAARAWLAEAEDAGHGEEDYSAVLARIAPGP
jgi:3-hydroxyisobutyrate dehydrogenase/2-hydroxy-3-oxopropionate reductase